MTKNRARSLAKKILLLSNRADYFPGNFNFPGTGIPKKFPGISREFPGKAENGNFYYIKIQKRPIFEK